MWTYKTTYHNDDEEFDGRTFNSDTLWDGRADVITHIVDFVNNDRGYVEEDEYEDVTFSDVENVLIEDGKYFHEHENETYEVFEMKQLG